MFAQAFPRIAPPSAPPVTIDPSDTLIEVTDFAGTITRDSSKLRLTRLIDTAPQGDTSNYKAAAPGSRFRFGVQAVEFSTVSIVLQFTGLVVRNDTYYDIGHVYLDGNFIQNVTCPVAWAGPGNAHPTGTRTVTLVVGPGTHTVDIILPYGASVDLTSISLAATQTLIAAQARPTTKAVFVGDSIIQGFSTTSTRTGWPFKTAFAESVQLIDLGYGGRRIVATDFTAAGSVGADWALTNIGINDAIGGNTAAYFKGVAKTSLTNYRAAATTAGKPTSRLYVVTPFWSDSPSLVTPLEDIRQAWRDAITEIADPYVTKIEGATGSMPTGIGNFPDHIHPNDAGATAIAAALSALIF
jgi:lysophospholipase L1-like esterase